MLVLFCFMYFRTCGFLAYGAQKAWLLNASLRENILFDNAYDEKRSVRALLLGKMSAPGLLT